MTTLSGHFRDIIINERQIKQAYKIKVGRYEYYCRISCEKIYDKIDNYNIDFGGRKKGCVTIRIPKYNPFFANQPDFRMAFIRQIHHDEKCALNKSLSSGTGTKHMIKTVLSIVRNIRTININRFILSDGSRKTCTDGSNISLSYMSIALYGKTYYEKHYFAQIDELAKDIYEQGIAKLFSVEEKSKVSFDLFRKLSCHKIDTKYLEKLEELYEKSSTFNVFFNKIKTTYPSTFCKVLGTWFQDFLMFYSFNGKDITTDYKWIIPVEKVDSIVVDNWTKTDEGDELVTSEEVDYSMLEREQTAGSPCENGQCWLNKLRANNKKK